MTQVHHFVLGESRELAVAVLPEHITEFVQLSGDAAPLHVDPEFARRHGFAGVVVHGAYLAALISRFVSMESPGPDALLERMDLAFRQPCYAPDRLTITGRVRQISEAVHSIVLDITVTAGDGRVVVTGKTWHRLLTGDQRS